MAKRVNYSDITDDIRKLTDICLENSNIDPELYNRYEVKRGLRDLNGKGVLAGLTEISEIRTLKIEDGVEKQCPGKLFLSRHQCGGYRERLCFREPFRIRGNRIPFAVR